MLTEEEARKKWCPFTRSEGGGRTINRIRNDPPWPITCHCVASECMAWEWAKASQTTLTDTQDRIDEKDDGSKIFVPISPDDDHRWRPEKTEDTRLGMTRWKLVHAGEPGAVGYHGCLPVGDCGLKR